MALKSQGWVPIGTGSRVRYDLEKQEFFEIGKRQSPKIRQRPPQLQLLGPIRPR